MNGTTGPGGRILCITSDGTLYSIPEHWAPLPMPTLNELADFLKPAPHVDPEPWRTLLRQLAGVDELPAGVREVLAESNPRAAIALHHWQRLSPLYPIVDAHGPTFGQLLDAINEAHQ